MFLLAGALVGCSDDDNDGRAVADSTPGQAVEVESVDSLVDVAASIGGPTVADTEIRYTDGEGVVSVGGLEVSMPFLEAMDYENWEGTITVPPSWRTLAVTDLVSYVGEDPSGNPTIGLAVLAQTTVVTDDASRARLI